MTLKAWLSLHLSSWRFLRFSPTLLCFPLKLIKLPSSFLLSLILSFFLKTKSPIREPQFPQQQPPHPAHTRHCDSPPHALAHRDQSLGMHRTYGECEAFPCKFLPQVLYEFLSYIFFLRDTKRHQLSITSQCRSILNTAHRLHGWAFLLRPGRCPSVSENLLYQVRRTQFVLLGCSFSQ